MKFIPLGSSSQGNAYLIDDGVSVLLVECGLSFRRLGQLVRGEGYALSQLAGCLVSHEHKDHSLCWKRLANSGIPVYASDGTIQELGGQGVIAPLAPPAGADFSPPVPVGSYDVIAFRTFHDAAEPVGFLIRSQADGERLVFATDTGNLRYQFPQLNQLAIEANYQEEIIARNTRMPETTVKRIRNTHMEIGRLCGYLSTLDLSGCKTIYLMHLSDASSDEEWFAQCVRRVAPAGCRVMVCPKGG
jgi:phosphoribosyl 1,2-cyclic phosphodiesterase